jgi:DNA-directed RNA polymerase beta' subunit
MEMSEKRLLKDYEIESIIAFIEPQQMIPIETAISIVNANKNELRKQLVTQMIYPEQIPKLKEMIEKQWNSSQVQAGESVGVIGAQSIGERQTQSTLNTFHKAGSGEKTATTGVPRVEEMLNATKDPKSVNCTVFTKYNHKTISELRETIGHKVVEMSFAKISKSYSIIMDKKPEKWYKAFDIMYGDSYKKFTDCVSIHLNMNMMYEYRLDMNMINNIVSEAYSDMICVFSPDNIGQLDVYVDTSNIDLPENRLDFINTDNAREIYLEEVVQPILYKIIICGVPGIENVYFNDNPNNFETNGSNYKKLLGLEFVDDTLTISNNVWDIYNTLGVEASRQFLIEEFMGLCTGINRCHIQLLVEKMTYNGSISSISRYTMRNEDCGPMGKASFEETMDNFLKAGAYGQREATRGVSASIICGKRANIGTGVCELMMDVKALSGRVRVLHDVQENNIGNNQEKDMGYLDF